MTRKHTISERGKRSGIHAPHITTSDDPITSMTWWYVAPRWVILQLKTKKGLVGWGEGTLEARGEVVGTQLTSLADFIIGADSANLEFIITQIRKQPFYSYACPVMNSALSAIDIALWDIKAKRAGAPLCELLGGRLHDRIRMYHWFGGNVPHVKKGSGAPTVLDHLETLLEGRNADQGLFFKMNALPEIGLTDTNAAIDHALEVLHALYAKYANTRVRFGIDCHGRLDVASARRFLAELQAVKKILLFVEELVPVCSVDMFPLLVQATDIPLATGERLYEFAPFVKLAQSGVSLLQPDVAHCQGVSTCMAVGRMAAALGVDTSYHCPNGPVSLAASVHLKAVLPGEAPQECSDGIHYSGDTPIGHYVTDPSVLRADEFGFMPIPKGPGLGIELDEKRLNAGARKPLWDESTCYLYDKATGCPRAW